MIIIMQLFKKIMVKMTKIHYLYKINNQNKIKNQNKY